MSNSNKRIAKNAAFLYLRTLFVMAVTLYTSRVVLAVLGIEDYGIYNVVGGVVAMLSFLNTAMVQATQRFLSFAQGKNDLYYQIRVYSTALVIHLSIALIIVLLLETVGLWYVNTKVVLPPERSFAARIVYQISIFVFVVRILSAPFTASVVANERMHVYALVSMLDAVLSLAIVYLIRLIELDKLIIYAILVAGVAIVNISIYVIYCKVKFPECVFRRIREWSLFKEMFNFASWAFLGSFGFVARMQGVNLVINLFCGPAVNAARAVAYQVSSAIQTFITSFLHAINPQITKRFAKGDVNSMMLLVRTGSKYTFLSLLICCTPIIVKSQYVLDLWLGNAPEFASQFLILALAMSLITSMGGTLNTAMQATGDIKLFQIVVSVIMCLDIPISYLLLQRGIQPYLVTGVSVATAFLCLIAKMLILRKSVQYDIKSFTLNIVGGNLVLAGVMIPFFYLLAKTIPSTIFGLLLLCILSVLIYSVAIYIFRMEQWEKKYFNALINKIYFKYIKHGISE